MNEQILKAIDEEIARMQQARAILAGAGAETPASEKPRRTMSAKAPKAIGEAQKRRWEKVHTLKKEVASAITPVRKENVAG